MKTALVLLGSGESKRFGNKKSKLFFNIYGSPLIDYTLKKFQNIFTKKDIYITIPKKITKKESIYLQEFSENPLIEGGSSRSESLKNALGHIDLNIYQYLLIHDAARPNTSRNLIKRIKKLLQTKKYDAVIPFIQITDTLKEKNKKIYHTVNRDDFINTQTPQGIKIKSLLRNLNSKSKLQTDDASIIEINNKNKIKYLEGDKDNIKITDKTDINLLKSYLRRKIKIGNGFDIHKLKAGKVLSLGGLKIKSDYTAVGHSDGDVVLHALIDAFLGTVSKGDIGSYFPALKKYKDISSDILFIANKRNIKFEEIQINNIDITIICQAIRLEKYKNKIKNNISKLCNCSSEIINVKAKTADNVGTIGKSKAIACWVTVTINE